MLTLRKLALVSLATAMTLTAAAGLAHAKSSLGIGTAEPSFSTVGPFGGLLSFVNQQQQAFYRALTGALKAMREDPWQLTSLIGLSFAYGIFHAAGPGHGKAVISSYMIANETELKRGMIISFISAFMQGAVAILLVGAAYLVLRGTSISLTQATQGLEILSFAMIALFGAWLLFRKLRTLFRHTAPVTIGMPMAMAGGIETGSSLHFQSHDDHDHHHHHHDHSHAGHHHAHSVGMVCDTCGHAHAPDPEMLRAETFSVREAWSAIVAVGLRPCSGALLVMTFSILNGLYLGGVLSVLAMSVGTAITVSALATLAVTAKDMALRYAGNGTTASMRIGNAIEIIGAIFVMLMGLILLGASLQG